MNEGGGTLIVRNGVKIGETMKIFMRLFFAIILIACNASTVLTQESMQEWQQYKQNLEQKMDKNWQKRDQDLRQEAELNRQKREQEWKQMELDRQKQDEEWQKREQEWELGRKKREQERELIGQKHTQAISQIMRGDQPQLPESFNKSINQAVERTLQKSSQEQNDPTQLYLNQKIKDIRKGTLDPAIARKEAYDTIEQGKKFHEDRIRELKNEWQAITAKKSPYDPLQFKSLELSTIAGQIKNHDFKLKKLKAAERRIIRGTPADFAFRFMGSYSDNPYNTTGSYLNRNTLNDTLIRGRSVDSYLPKTTPGFFARLRDKYYDFAARMRRPEEEARFRGETVPTRGAFARFFTPAFIPKRTSQETQAVKEMGAARIYGR